MSDDLVKQLRAKNAYCAPNFSTPIADPVKLKAADRIEELEAAVKLNQDLDTISLDHVADLEAKLSEARLSELAALGQADEAYTTQLELEVKLAKAVEALRFYGSICADKDKSPWNVYSEDFGKKARTTLAELKGEK